MKLKVETRDIRGKDVKRLRREGQIPAIIYGKHIDDSMSIVCDKNEFVKLYRKAGSSTPITLAGEGIEEMVLVHDYQLDPVSDVVLHVDFLALTKGEKVSAEISIVMVGDEESSLVKAGDANIQLVKDSLAIEALPKDLVKEIVVDVSDIDDLSTTIFVKDLELPSGVEIKDDIEQAVITVMELKDIPEEEEVVEEATVEGEEGEGGEGESSDESKGEESKGGESE